MKRYVIVLTEEQIDSLRQDEEYKDSQLPFPWPGTVIKDILAQANALDQADSDYRLNLEDEE